MLAVADVLLRNQSALVRTLTEIATHASATDEINRSLMALAGAAWEIERARPPNTGTISVFHPSNNVLYAYVLYAVIPCLFANRVVVRPSARATRPVLDVHGLITNSVELPIEVTTVTQREFLSTVAGSDVVVFTGRYDNALSVAGGLRRDQLLVYFGGGLNPIVVGAEADLEAAARDSVRARLYNSGQDCLCPDVIFVQDSVSEVFMRALLHELTPIRLAESRTEVGARLAPIYYYDILPRLERFLEGCQDRIVFGGHIVRAAQTVQPTVLVSDLDAQLVETEFFAPVFNVVRYRQPEALRNWLLSKRAVEHAMYLSEFPLTLSGRSFQSRWAPIVLSGRKCRRPTSCPTTCSPPRPTLLQP